MSSKSNQLTMATGYDVNNMIFSKPEENVIPNSNPQIKYSRINISTKNPDGSMGDLILPTETLYSFGLSDNVDAATGKSNGLSMALCMWARDNASDAEKAWTTTFDKIVEHCKDHLLDTKDDIGKYDLERNDLKKLNSLYWKRDKGKIVEGTGPMLYVKLIHSKKQDKFISKFFDEQTDQEIDVQSLIGKAFYATSAIKIESIYIGSKISLQVKLFECNVRLLDTSRKRLLGGSRLGSSSSFAPQALAPTLPPVQSAYQPSNQNEIENSDDEEDNDDASPPPPPPVTTTVKKLPAKKK
jgi:hypothetical protein